NWSNDLPFSDKGRTASAEIGFGQNLIGFNVYTNEDLNRKAAYESVGEGTDYDSPIGGRNPEGTYVNGKPYFSAFYYARRSGGNVTRAGLNQPWVQDLFQNVVAHKGLLRLLGGKAPYFRPGNYGSVYGYHGRYNPFIY
ncbi:MAG TPA: polymorphic toxin type 23 domain-containing protein, partial [bacterium]|nr:polymorphic toxin type 23 domain-containing protein [bacterium]HNH34242.1 polymorphic toxin type 23 domain-containing protein [bacterium]